ncbi:hypothetical protein H8356DRAFT_1432750 [Neocallimastix lanati (nom. inval.)]|nr:hypothetical protein H8356DRAFT_1432750 [Neocallimastix sp. JGI-2020a]
MEKNQENEIKHDDSYNHLENKFEAAKSIVKNKIKDEILSINMNLICPRYNSIKSKLPPDLTTFDEIPNKSKCYKAKKE